MFFLTATSSKHRLFGIAKVWGIGEKAARGAQSSEALHVSPYIWKFRLMSCSWE